MAIVKVLEIIKKGDKSTRYRAVERKEGKEVEFVYENYVPVNVGQEMVVISSLLEWLC